ncbi:MAG TPA: zf-TFIIB domain-containing protein [Acidimicrobiia bacterium]|nr:zf-TFIIB domain-containing protein [Acidimicrobiia bacterium]
MKCPFDDTQLRTIEKNGIEIDWCETCKGVWLERGELDKIVERVADELLQSEPQPEWSGRSRDPRYDRDDHREPRYERDHKKKKSKSSFLSEMFEF